jgi:signal transduction histidine kinase
MPKVLKQTKLHLTLRYCVALGIIATMLATSMATREWHHYRHRQLRLHSDYMNRELRLVNRTVLMVRALASIHDVTQRATLYAQYRGTIEEMQHYEDMIEAGPSVRAVDAYFVEYLAVAERIARLPDAELQASHPDYQQLMALGSGAPYQHAGEWIQAYEAGEERLMQEIRFLEWVLFWATLMSLLLVGVFIFRPMVRAVNRAQDYLVQLNRLKSEFMANMSH